MAHRMSRNSEPSNIMTACTTSSMVVMRVNDGYMHVHLLIGASHFPLCSSRADPSAGRIEVSVFSCGLVWFGLVWFGMYDSN